MDQTFVERMKLNHLLNASPELNKVLMNDPSAYAWRTHFDSGRCTLEEMLSGVIVDLAKAKETLYQQALSVMQNGTQSKMVLPDNMELLKKQGDAL